MASIFKPIVRFLEKIQMFSPIPGLNSVMTRGGDNPFESHTFEDDMALSVAIKSANEMIDTEGKDGK